MSSFYKKFFLHSLFYNKPIPKYAIHQSKNHNSISTALNSWEHLIGLLPCDDGFIIYSYSAGTIFVVFSYCNQSANEFYIFTLPSKILLIYVISISFTLTGGILYHLSLPILDQIIQSLILINPLPAYLFRSKKTFFFKRR